MSNIITVLVGLRLQNIALIKTLDLAFDKGLTVLTGETGAGKSILLDALDALFGGNTLNLASKLLRSGSDFAQVEATFLINKKVEKWMENNQIDTIQDELIISREWKFKENKWISRSRINGIIVNKQQINSLRPLMIDLTIQGGPQRFSSSSEQLSIIDQYGYKSINPVLLKVKEKWQEWIYASRLLQEALLQKEEITRRLEESKMIFNDLDSASLLDPEEDIKLKNEQDRLVHGVRLEESSVKILGLIKEGSENQFSLYDLISLVIQELKIMNQYDKSTKEILEKAIDIYQPIQDLISQVEEYVYTLESDSERLDELQERLNKLQRLQKIHNLKLPQLINLRDTLFKTVFDDNPDNHIKKLHNNEEVLRLERDSLNKNLTSLRCKIARELEEKLVANLSPMGLSNALFKVQVDPSEPSHKGADSVKLMFSANPGEPLALLADTASGGEMSRFILALKATISQKETPSTMLFDEIDSGVSGRISSAIASVLKDLSRSQQVFCVTHQPLVAAAADHHFSVHKSVNDGRTTSSVRILCSLSDRQKELAELAGGNSREAENYAASLLEHHAA